jgi:hypothetical protein
MPSLEFFIPSNRLSKKGRPAPLDGLNELVAAERSGYRVGNALKRKNGMNAEASCLYAMRVSGWETPNAKCRVTLTFVEPHDRRDPDNIFGGAKFILDGIISRSERKSFGAGAVVDDSQRWIELRFGDIEIDREHPGCRVLIETLED